MPESVGDLTGQTFGRLTVVSFHSKTKGRTKKYNCKCECGKSKVVCGSSLKRGHTKSCGCLPRPRKPVEKPRPYLETSARKQDFLASVGWNPWHR